MWNLRRRIYYVNVENYLEMNAVLLLKWFDGAEKAVNSSRGVYNRFSKRTALKTFTEYRKTKRLKLSVNLPNINENPFFTVAPVVTNIANVVEAVEPAVHGPGGLRRKRPLVVYHDVVFLQRINSLRTLVFPNKNMRQHRRNH